MGQLLKHETALVGVANLDACPGTCYTAGRKDGPHAEHPLQSAYAIFSMASGC